MSTVLTILALAGVAAAAWHFVRAAFRFLRHGATGYWTDEMARTHARLGDVTAMEEARRERDAQSRSKRRAGLVAVGWLVLLVVPTFTAWPEPIYGGYAALWLLPLARRGVKGGAGGEVGR